MSSFNSKNIEKIFSIFLFFVVFLPYVVIADTQIHFLDVGDGDAVLIQGEESNLLIDSGPYRNTTAYYLKQHNITTLDAVILTSPSPDRIIGMQEVFNSTLVGEYLDSGIQSTLPDFLSLKKSVQDFSIPERVLNAGDVYQPEENLSIEVIQPTKSEGEWIDDGMVLMIKAGNISILLMADKAVPDENIEPAADIMRIADHGSRSGTDPGFVREVSPDIAIISSGYDPERELPSQATLATLDGISATIYNTHTYGSVVIITDGNGYTIQTTKEAPSGILSLVSVIETRPPS